MRKNNAEYYKAICKNLKKFRKGCNLSQQQVAESIGIDRSTYAYYESGRTIPGFDTMDMLTKIFNISYDELFASVKPDA